jgi:cell division protein FtsQ
MKEPNKPQHPKAKASQPQARPGVRRIVANSVRSARLFALAILAGAGWLLYDVLTDERFVVRDVQAVGMTALTVEDVQTLADVEGRSIWDVRAEEIAARVQQSPYVEQVSARVVLPDQVVVEVRERRPDVRWLHNGTTYDVAWDGTVMGEAPPEPVAATDTITATGTISETDAGPDFVTSVSIVDTTPNRTIKARDRVDPDALEIARRVSLRAAELPAPLQRIEWDAGLGVSLIVADGKQAVIGKSERLDEKLAVLAQLLRDGTPFSYLDLRSSAPYYR